MPSQWRFREQQTQQIPDAIYSLESGARGFRFDSAAGWLTGKLPSSDTIPIGQVIKVHWSADPNALYGVILRTGQFVEYWLVSDRISLRLAAHSILFLVDDTGARMVDLPTIGVAYQLDTELWASNSVDGFQGRCIAAEASLLADAEIRLIKRDENAGRFSHVDAGNLQNRLAPLLSSTTSLCRDH